MSSASNPLYIPHQFRPISIGVVSSRNCDEDTKSPYTEYTVAVEWNRSLSWTISHRFSKFEELRTKLSDKDIGSQLIPQLPGKTWRRSLDPELIKSRREALNQFMKLLIQIDFVLIHPAFLVFCLIEPSTGINIRDIYIPVEIKSLKDPQFGINQLQYYESELLLFTASEDSNFLSKLDRKFSNLRLPFEKQGALVPIGSFSCFSVVESGEWKAKCSIYYPVPVSSICYQHSMKRVYIGLENGHVMDYRAEPRYEDFSLVSDIASHTARVTGIAAISSKGLIISISHDKNLVVYNQSECSILSTTITGSAWLNTLLFDEEYCRGFIGTWNQQILIYSFTNCGTGGNSNSSPILLTALTGHSSAIRSLSFSSTDRLLFSGSNDGIIGIWNIFKGSTKEEVGRSRSVGFLKNGPQRKVSSVVFSSSLRQIYCGHEGGGISVWYLNNGKLLYTWRGHENDITTLDLIDNAKILISSSLDGNAKFWRLNDILQLAELPKYNKGKSNALKNSTNIGAVVTTGEGRNSITTDRGSNIGGSSSAAATILFSAGFTSNSTAAGENKRTSVNVNNDSSAASAASALSPAAAVASIPSSVVASVAVPSSSSNSSSIQSSSNNTAAAAANNSSIFDFDNSSKSQQSAVHHNTSIASLLDTESNNNNNNHNKSNSSNRLQSNLFDDDSNDNHKFDAGSFHEETLF